MMKPLSPVDALAPAFSRMRTILLPGSQPGVLAPRFRFSFFLKIAVVAALTNVGFYGASIGMIFQGLSIALTASRSAVIHRHSWFVATSDAAVPVMAALAIAGLLVLAAWILAGWLLSRLRFTLFDLVVYRHGRVGLAWSPYGAQAWRYLGLIVLLFLAFLLLIAGTAGPMLLHFLAAIRHAGAQHTALDPADVFASILPLYGLMLLFGIAGTVADGITQDFLLPPIASEDAPLEASIGRFFRLLRDSFWSVLFYLLLRFIVEIGLTWAGLMMVGLAFLIAGGSGAGIGLLLYHALWRQGGMAALLFLLYCTVAAVLVLALYLLAMICVYGIVGLFKECYAVYFYGSHYQQLGDRLDPGDVQPAPVPSTPPPPVFPPAFGSPPVY